MERPSAHPSILGLAGFVGLAFLAIIVLRQAYADCPEGFGPLDPEPNVTWTFKDSIAACPAGDSLVFTTNPHKPSQLRIVITYLDSNCDPKVVVPPESIYVTTTTHSGNAKVNDQPKIFADDSTNASGQARVTVRSISGAGKLKIRIIVSGALQAGYSTPAVRSTDSNANGRVTSTDASELIDLDYNGVTTKDDLEELLVYAEHTDDWHRNALYGTPVRRTNLTAGGLGSYGAGWIGWNSSSDRIVYSSHVGPNLECVVLSVAASPSGGNTPQQHTFPPAFKNDYNPSWSPRGNEFTFDRSDLEIIRKGLIPPDDVEVVLVSGIPLVTLVTEGAISPNGRTVVYVRIDAAAPGDPAQLFTVPITGGTPTQLTFGSVQDRHPQWSPDGLWVYFERFLIADPNDSIVYRVPAAGGAPVLVHDSPTETVSRPGISPDGKVGLIQIGPIVGAGTANSLDLGILDQAPAIQNYAAYPSSSVYPRMSPDGTRLAFVSPPPGSATLQIWAVRRNMNLPPTLTAIGDKVVTEGNSLNFSISASDPESDARTYDASFLEPGMTFNPATRTFSWLTPPGSGGNSYWVKFRATTQSGGTASEVVKISVIAPGRQANAPSQEAGEPVAGFENPSRGRFVLEVPVVLGTGAHLTVTDIAGRRVATLGPASPGRFVWEARDSHGIQVPTGVYLYRIEGGDGTVRRGKWVLVR